MINPISEKSHGTLTMYHNSCLSNTSDAHQSKAYYYPNFTLRDLSFINCYKTQATQIYMIKQSQLLFLS